ncbi:ABC transporter permease [Corynebacterium sp. H130]|uniref:ABC transporter permease n=1 Tax=Corynebacterium sp. H130 TaxID=3133444 RepID=UPI0030B47311
MFQGIKELRRAPGRAALITVTIGLIAVLVSFLSALTAGLSHQSISALDYLSEDKQGLIVADDGSTTLSASRVSPSLAGEVGGTALYLVRDRVDNKPVVYLSDPALHGTEVKVNSTLSQDVQLRGQTLIVTGTQDLWLDHTPVVTASPALLESMGEPPVAVLADSPVAPPPGTKMLTGKDIFKVSASYVGENLSLTTMTTLLFAISALVVGAFFTVWTIQRLGSVAVSLALGSARKVVLADALSQALIVLAVGIGAGTLLTILVASFAPAAMPVELSWNTTALPALILLACGLVGAAFSLIPVMRVEPRSALAQF